MPLPLRAAALCRVRPGYVTVAVLASLFALAPRTGRATEAIEAAADLSRMSLDQLANVEVTSVSKAPEPLRRAPATIFVITHEAIARSGATSLIEALRLAPNLQVIQLTANNYALGARGFGGHQESQNFANKLLILIDGRSVYSPLFSGIYSDAQDVLLEDVDRIEVISGPGGTLWGANAMNGVINIITRPAYLTDGTLVQAGLGNQDQNVAARYGGKLSGDTSYRVYGMAFHRGAMEMADGSSAHDGWNKGQGGFRLDWNHAQDSLTVQGDAYRATENELGADDGLVLGANALARWQHHTDGSVIQLQAYYDQTERFGPLQSGAFVLHTYDVEAQQSLQLGAAQRLVWGAGERINSYGITNTPTLLFLPEQRALTLTNAFVQDTVSLGEAVQLTVGLKMEDDPYSGWGALPDARLLWELSGTASVWAAASRGIRSPTPFDTDVVEKLGTTVFLTGNPKFAPEKVSAYEVGYRGQPATALSMSISLFYNVYDDLRTIELASSTAFLPLHWGNLMRGDTYGVTAWADWQASDWLRLSPGFRLLRKHLRFEAGASELLGIAQAGDDPASQANLTVSMDLGHSTTFDASVRYVGSLPDPGLKAYCDMTARLAWRASRALELSVSGTNLIHARHQEYPGPTGEEIGRAGMVEARWSF